MKRFIGLLIVVVAMLASVSAALAYNSVGDYFQVLNVQMSRTTGAARDTITILSGDTLRTADINTQDWDWAAAVAGQGSSAYIPGAVARVDFWSETAQNNADAVGDSLYFGVEQGFERSDGTIFYQPCTYQPAANLGTYAGAVGNCALQASPIGADAGVHSYTGFLVIDKDNTSLVPAPHNNIFGMKHFRLVIHGDISSTAQALGGYRLQITKLIPNVKQ